MRHLTGLFCLLLLSTIAWGQGGVRGIRLLSKVGFRTQEAEYTRAELVDRASKMKALAATLPAELSTDVELWPDLQAQLLYRIHEAIEAMTDAKLGALEIVAMRRYGLAPPRAIDDKRAYVESRFEDLSRALDPTAELQTVLVYLSAEGGRVAALAAAAPRQRGGSDPEFAVTRRIRGEVKLPDCKSRMPSLVGQALELKGCGIRATWGSFVDLANRCSNTRCVERIRALAYELVDLAYELPGPEGSTIRFVEGGVGRLLKTSQPRILSAVADYLPENPARASNEELLRAVLGTSDAGDLLSARAAAVVSEEAGPENHVEVAKIYWASRGVEQLKAEVQRVFGEIRAAR